MRIKQINRRDIRGRDFYADWECENCGYVVLVYYSLGLERDKYGYFKNDETNFYANVLPNKKCPKCGKSSNDLGLEAGVTCVPEIGL